MGKAYYIGHCGKILSAKKYIKLCGAPSLEILYPWLETQNCSEIILWKR